MVNSINFLMVGVGGQGTILVSDILSEVGMLAGYDAKKSDNMGLSVRGGAVSSHVRWDKDGVGSPMSMTGTVDILIGSEPMETKRSVQLLRKGAKIITNTYVMQPMSVSTGLAKYPTQDEIDKCLHDAASEVISYDATTMAVELGNVKVMNIILLGTLCKMLDVDYDKWIEAIKKYVPAKQQEINIKAFDAGRNL